MGVRRAVLALVTLVGVLAAAPSAAAAGGVLPLKPLVGFNGLYALPANTPTQLVLMAHGHQNSSLSWVTHLEDAAKHGAIAVAPDYRGLGPAPTYVGWPAKAGAQDLVSSAKYFLSACPTIKQVFLYGVSMGGHISGMALFGTPKRADGSPLFDYWIDVEGVNNWIEEYFIARGVAPVNAGGAVAQQEIETETGGPFETNSQAFLDRNLVNHASDIQASGIKGAILVHAVEDGLVPFNQDVEMVNALRAAGEPTDWYPVLRRTSDRDPGHEQSSILGIPSSQTGDADPFAGHGWEGSNTQIVIVTGLQRLWALMDGKGLPVNNNFLVDSGLGSVPAAEQASGHIASSSLPSAPPCSSGVAGASVQAAGTLAVLPNTGARLPIGALALVAGGLVLLIRPGLLRFLARVR